ncbi:3-oxoacyl-[acyl-carrier-protein] synthase [Tulasnella sp. 427]|nr:3-oxoacyl-[acyl-carrier-protein] synthase [Tulasnella sp. 427]
MWSSSATRKYVGNVAAEGRPERVVSCNVDFVGRLCPVAAWKSNSADLGKLTQTIQTPERSQIAAGDHRSPEEPHQMPGRTASSDPPTGHLLPTSNLPQQVTSVASAASDITPLNLKHKVGTIWEYSFNLTGAYFNTLNEAAASGSMFEGKNCLGGRLRRQTAVDDIKGEVPVHPIRVPTPAIDPTTGRHAVQEANDNARHLRSDLGEFRLSSQPTSYVYTRMSSTAPLTPKR